MHFKTKDYVKDHGAMLTSDRQGSNAKNITF